MPMYRVLTTAMVTTFNERTGAGCDFLFEFMDMEKFRGRDYLDRLAGLYKEKYKHIKLDLIISINPPALDFLGNYGDEVFAGVPIVFCAVWKNNLENNPLKKNMTGMVQHLDIAGTLDIALKLQPNAKKVAVVAGTSAADNFFLNLARRDLDKYRDRMELTYLNQMPMDRLLNRASTLPANSIILYLMFHKDITGRTFVPRDVLIDLAKRANVPVYGIMDAFLGYGIIGGSLVSFEDQGRKAASMGIDILKGKKPSDIPLLLNLGNPGMFDWRQLSRWDLDQKKLPPGSVIKFKERSFWDIYRWQISGGIILCILEALLIMILVVNRNKRRLAEIALKNSHEELEQRVSDRTADLTRTNDQLNLEVAERENTARQLSQALEEKNVLLKELHHRVKNNMQVVVSLLNLQVNRLQDPGSKEIFRESQSRVRAMALVHEVLYRSSSLAMIDLNDYVDNLIKNLLTIYGSGRGRVTIDQDIEAVSMDINKAVPCGLVVNELVTNTLKYAFPGDRQGRIHIRARNLDGDLVELEIKDNGVGIPEDLDWRQTDSLGLRLVKILTESQLKARVELFRDNGTVFKMKFSNPTHSSPEGGSPWNSRTGDSVENPD